MNWNDLVQESTVAVIGGFVGAIGALLVASHTLAKSARQARAEWHASEIDALARRMHAVQTELLLNVSSLRWMRAENVTRIRVRREALDQIIPDLAELSISASVALMKAGFTIDRYNALIQPRPPEPGVRQLGSGFNPFTLHPELEEALLHASDELVNTDLIKSPYAIPILNAPED